MVGVGVSVPPRSLIWSGLFGLKGRGGTDEGLGAGALGIEG